MNFKDYQHKNQDTFAEKASKIAFLGWLALVFVLLINYIL
jgi:hypothetical protein